MSDIAELRIKVDSKDGELAKQVLDRLTQSGTSTAKSADVMTASYGRLMAVLGPTALTAAVVSNTKAMLAMQESYVRMSEVAGTTASRMSSFELSARLSGTSMDSVAQSVARLGKELGEARLGDVQKQGIFRALGIDPNDGRDAAQVMVDVAKAVTQMKDQTLASAVSQQLLSRGYAEMRPLMKEITEQGSLVALVTDEQAERAKELADRWTRLGLQWDIARMNMANDLIPTLEQVTSEIEAIAQETGAAQIVSSAIVTTFQTLVVIGSDVAFTFKMIGGELGVIAAQVAAVARGDFEGFSLIGEEWKQDAAQARKDLDDFQQRIMNLGQATAKAREQAAGGSSGAAGGGNSAATEQRLRDLMSSKASEELLRGLSEELAKTRGLTREEEVLRQLQEKRYEMLNKADKGRAIDLARQIDLLKVEEELRKRANAEAETYAKANDQYLQTREDLQRAGFEQVRQLEFEIGLIGKSEEEIERLNNMRRIEIELRQAIAALPDVTPEQVQALREDAEVRRQRLEIILQEKQAREAEARSSDERTRDMLEQYRRAQEMADKNRDILSQSITDGIMRGFERGEDFWENFGNSLRRAVLTITVQPMVLGAANMITAPISGALSSLGGSLMSGLGMNFGGGNLLGSMANWGGSMSGSSMAQAMGMGQWVDDLSGVAQWQPSAAGSALGSFASVAPFLPGAMMLMQGNTKGGLGSLAGAGIGTFFGGPIGGAVGAAVGGMIFGGEDGDAMRYSDYRAGFGSPGEGSYVNRQWFGNDMVPTLTSFSAALMEAEQNIITNLHLSADQVAAVDAALAGIRDKQYAFGMEHTDWLQSGAAEQIQADRLQVIAETLGRTVEELSTFMALGAEEMAAATALIEEQIFGLRLQSKSFQLDVQQKIFALGGSGAGGGILLQQKSILETMLSEATSSAAKTAILDQLSDVVSSWAAARVSALEREKELIQQAADERISGLQEELALQENWMAALSQARAMMGVLTLSDASPMSAAGRLQLASMNVAQLQQDFAAAQGDPSTRGAIAQDLLTALGTYLDLAQSVYQRPSAEYMAIYNEVVSQVADIQSKGETHEEQVLAIQTEISAIQEEALIQLAAIDQTIAATNTQAIEWLQTIQEQGALYYQEQELTAVASLEALQAGLTLESHIANKSTETVLLLTQIRDQLTTAPGFAGGIDYVPTNGMLAKLHQGEKVLTAAANAGGDGGLHLHLTLPGINESNINGLGAKLQKELKPLMPWIKKELKIV